MSRLGESGSKVRIVVQPSQHPRQLARVSGRRQYPVDPVRDDLCGSPRGGGDDRQPGRHALEHYLAERFGDDGTVDEHIEFTEFGPHILPEAAELDLLGDAKAVDLPPE